jgi:Xaa-Pro aminopeptidase
MPRSKTITDERFINPISNAELDRRWRAIREIMDRHAVDALVLQNSNDWLGGYVRWFTGVPANNAYPRAILFPRHGGMTIVEQGGSGDVRVPAAEDAFNRGVAQIATTPSYVTARQSESYDAELIAAEIRAGKFRRIGWVNPAAAYFGFGRALEKLVDGMEWDDVTGDIDLIKAIKSSEEWSFIKQTAHLQDRVVEEVRKFIRPGLHDFEIAAFAQYQAQLFGAEQGIYISSSSPPGQAAVFRPRHAQGRKIENGDAFALLVETNGPGGYYTEIGRTFVLGKASNALKAAVADVIEAQANTLRMLKPGAKCADIFAAHNRYMRDKGLPEEKRLYSHGQGYDMVERPLIRDDETMSLETGMSIVVHPGYIRADANALVCDNYPIESDGATDCLHKTPKNVIEL